MCIPLVIHYKDLLEDKSHYVVRLKKNLYDLKQTVMNWYHKLRHGLLARGYTKSVVDTYFFIKDDILCLIYVDDTIFFAKDQSLIDREITDMKQDFDLTDEGEVDAFLGIDIKYEDDGTITMTYPGLIDQVLKDVNIENESKTHDTPVITEPLFKYSDGTPPEGNWSYR